jgi:hypothetical protein
MELDFSDNSRPLAAGKEELQTGVTAAIFEKLERRKSE